MLHSTVYKRKWTAVTLYKNWTYINRGSKYRRCTYNFNMFELKLKTYTYGLINVNSFSNAILVSTFQTIHSQKIWYSWTTRIYTCLVVACVYYGTPSSILTFSVHLSWKCDAWLLFAEVKLCVAKDKMCLTGRLCSSRWTRYVKTSEMLSSSNPFFNSSSLFIVHIYSQGSSEVFFNFLDRIMPLV
jgi:Mn2+/Fe2+ NRAMP family transporter